MRRRGQRGFTLIELLIVIAIIAVLAALLLAALNSAQKSARDAQRLSDLNQIKVALNNYHAGPNTYPSTSAGLAALKPEFLDPIPEAPAAGPPDAQTYRYFRGSVSGFVACVRSEHDPDEWFWATSVGTEKEQSGACTAEDGA